MRCAGSSAERLQQRIDWLDAEEERIRCRQRAKLVGMSTRERTRARESLHQLVSGFKRRRRELRLDEFLIERDVLAYRDELTAQLRLNGEPIQAEGEHAEADRDEKLN